MVTHSSILAWKIPWTEEPRGCGPWGCGPWGCKGSGMTECLSKHTKGFEADKLQS